MLTNELVSCQSARKLQSAETCVDEQIIPFPGRVYSLLFTHNGRSECCHFGPTYAQKQTCPLTFLIFRTALFIHESSFRWLLGRMQFYQKACLLKSNLLKQCFNVIFFSEIPNQNMLLTPKEIMWLQFLLGRTRGILWHGILTTKLTEMGKTVVESWFFFFNDGFVLELWSIF